MRIKSALYPPGASQRPHEFEPENQLAADAVVPDEELVEHSLVHAARQQEITSLQIGHPVERRLAGATSEYPHGSVDLDAPDRWPPVGCRGSDSTFRARRP
jgi:hypothetical protein